MIREVTATETLDTSAYSDAMPSGFDASEYKEADETTFDAFNRARPESEEGFAAPKIQRPERSPEQMMQDLVDIKSGVEPQVFDASGYEEASEATFSRVRPEAEEELLQPETPEIPRSSVKPFFPSKEDDTAIEIAAKSFGNIPTSTAGLVTDVYGAISSPWESVKGLGKMGLGAIMNVIDVIAEELGDPELNEIRKEKFPLLRESDEIADAVGNMMKERYGGWDEIKATITEDPVGVLGDIATIVGIPAGALSKAGTAGKFAKLAKASGEVAKVTRAVEPIALITKSVGGIPRLLTKPLKSTPLAIRAMEEAISIQPSRASKIKKMTGDSTGKWLVERGFSGDEAKIASDLTEAAEASMKYVDESIKGVKTIINEPKAIQALGVMEETLSGVVGMEDELGKIQKMQKTIAEGASLEQLQEVKRMIDRTEKIFKTTGDVKDSVKAKGLQNIRKSIQTTIENEASKVGIKDIAEANKQTQVAREIVNAIEAAAPAKIKKFLPSLNELIGPAALLYTGNLPLAAGMFALEKVLSSPKALSWVANRLSKLSPKELIGIEKALSSKKGLSVAQKAILAEISKEMVEVARLLEKSEALD